VPKRRRDRSAALEREAERSRVQLGRDRAHRAKVVLAVAGAGAFALASVLARVSNAGHGKQALHPLVAPPRFVSVVKENLLEAGLVAPPEAPPGAATGTS
jgi:hypothetical protein